MQLNSIFKKSVDRHIEGVIKADDEEMLRLELDEYILTHEVEKRLAAFLEAYNNYEGANGVWISGFFGSGKSHLLKMLAVLLENREVTDMHALDYFLEKCGDNELLLADLKKACTIPSKSILFNIDQKADVISKTEFDAVLAVFVKVFDEMNGYYGKQGHIAQFERDLDERGTYEKFKTAYEEVAGKTWSRGREQALLESKNIATAYANAAGDDAASADRILDKYRAEYKLSIEDFADQVSKYIKKQEKGFRLNFFVDEVGQYVSDNVKLMTNLQTIAESLATKCRGAAWVVVTAQEDMSTVIGEFNKKQGDDFTKIQARFSNRMKLTSADVAEVIQKRLLMKNEQGEQALAKIYAEEQNNFRTLFDFAEGSQTYQNFQDEEHFVRSYPFIPYQFALFQSSIRNLSHHNAFEGRHSSVGERSMLAVFQEVAIHVGERNVGQLATFDLMFEGLRTALKTGIQKAIIQAERHLDDAFAVQVLKALFLVKYVKEFKPTVRNLCVLMLDSFDQNLPELQKKIEAALGLLEQQTYVQRNGDLYEFLTDEEKDVEQEIKNTDVDTADVFAELEKSIFESVIKARKIRFENNKQDYQYSRKLDDKLFGREYELSINIITPFNENASSEQVLRMQNMGRNELMVIMPAEDRLMRDLVMYKKTEKYVRQNMSMSQVDSTKRILSEKSHQNAERLARLQEMIKELVVQSKLLAGENEIEIISADAQTRIFRAFQQLITRAYPNLRMLRDVPYTENAIASVLAKSNDSLFANDATSLAESEQEVFAFVQSNNRGGVRTTLKGIIEQFEKKPYGWYYAAVLCTIASLCARGKLELRDDSNLLGLDEIEAALKNTRSQGNVIVEPQVEFTASQVRGLKELYSDLFDSPPKATEAKALGQEAAAEVGKLSNELSQLAVQSSRYPFLKQLEPIVENLKDYAGKPYTWFLSEFVRIEDELLDQKENTIDPIKKFMSGSQRKIFDQASEFIEEQRPNISYINDPGFESIKVVLADPACFKGNKLQDVKTNLDGLERVVAHSIETEANKAMASVTERKDRLNAMPEFMALSEDQQASLNRSFTEFANAIKDKKLIAVIRDQERDFAGSRYQQILAKLAEFSATPSADDDSPSGEQGQTSSSGAGCKENPVSFVNINSLNIGFDKAWLATESDVDTYTSKFRELLMEELKKGNRIQI